MTSKSTSEKIGFHLSLRLIAGLSATLLTLLLVFAIYNRLGLDRIEEDSGVLELMAAVTPLLSLLLAAIFSGNPKQRQAGRQQPRRANAQRLS